MLKKKKPRKKRRGGRKRKKQTVAGLKLGKLGSPVQLVASRRKLGTNANSKIQMPGVG